MELSEREKLLIVEGLRNLEFQCEWLGGWMDCDAESKLGGIPKSEEVQALRNKIREAWKIAPLEKPETCACDGCAQCAAPGECDMDADTVHKGTPMCSECARQAWACLAREHEHEWEVYSTAVVGTCIMVRCGCGAAGDIPNGRFEHADWSKAFHAPSNPYPLREGLVAAVEIYGEKGP